MGAVRSASSSKLPGLDLHYLYTDPARCVIAADTGYIADYPHRDLLYTLYTDSAQYLVTADTGYIVDDILIDDLMI